MERKKKVLVIEDTDIIRDFLCELLRTSGFEVRGCDNGMSGLETAAKEGFDVVITDYDMPAMNGADVTRHLRSAFPASIILGVSCADKEADFLGAGANAFLMKPYRPAELLAILAGTTKCPVSR